MGEPKRYEVRLQSQTDHHTRTTRLQAADAEEAAAICERNEYAACAYQMPYEQLNEAETLEAVDQPLTGALKGRLHAHRQAKPYLVESVTEIEGD
jgi:hypothetical protein